MKLAGSDLRSSAALVIAAIIAKDISYIFGLEHLDRGYENFELKLAQLGVNIVREGKKNFFSQSKLNNKSLSQKKILQTYRLLN